MPAADMLADVQPIIGSQDIVFWRDRPLMFSAETRRKFDREVLKSRRPETVGSDGCSASAQRQEEGLVAPEAIGRCQAMLVVPPIAPRSRDRSPCMTLAPVGDQDHGLYQRCPCAVRRHHAGVLFAGEAGIGYGKPRQTESSPERG